MSVRNLAALVLLLSFSGTSIHAQEEPPIPKKPSGFLDLGVPGQEPTRQPVGESNADLRIVLLPQGDETLLGEPYRLDVKVVGDPFRTANNVRVVISARTRRGNASDVRIDQVSLGGQVCRASEKASRNERTCVIPMIAPGGQAELTVSIRTSAGAEAGDLVLSARALIGEAERAAEEKIVKVVTKGRLSEAGLTVQIDRDTHLATTDAEFFHVVKIHNSSTVEAATDVVVEIQQRFGVREGATFRPLPPDALRRGLSTEIAWKIEGLTARGRLERIEAGATIRMPIEMKLLRELVARQWGRVETQARVRAAQSDPKPGDNHAVQVTDLASRLPELAFISRSADARGNTKFRAQRSVAYRQTFGVGARFLDPLLRPEGDEIEVQIVVNDEPPVPMQLRFVARDQVYRSSPMILLLPRQAKPDGSSATPMYASPGSTVRLRYKGSETSIVIVEK